MKRKLISIVASAYNEEGNIKILKWEPKICFEDGLKITIEWFKKFLTQFNDPNSPVFALADWYNKDK